MSSAELLIEAACQALSDDYWMAMFESACVGATPGRHDRWDFIAASLMGGEL